MALSLHLGRDHPTDSKDRCYQVVREFLSGFTAEFGEINCFKLTGLHLGTPEGQAAFESKGVKAQCTEYVGEAVRLVLGLVDGKNLQG